MGCLNVDDLGNLFNEKVFDNDIYADVEDVFEGNINLMRSAQLYYFKFYLPMVLSKVDQASMLNSVESRSPFLDWQLSTYLFSLPTQSKIGKGFTKRILIISFCKFAKGTYSLLHEISSLTNDNNLISIICGGDTATCCENSNLEKSMSHISTGGGSCLELLEGKILPGIKHLYN